MRTGMRICAFLAIVLAGICAAFASAEAFGAFEYRVNEDGTISITGYTQNAESIVIPGEIEGMPVVSVSFDPAVRHSLLYKTLEEVTLPEGVIRLDGMAFEGLNALHRVNGLDHLQEVEYLALANTSITEAVFGRDLTLLGSQALAWTKVERVVLPGDVELYSSSFQETYYLKEIEMLASDRAKYAVSGGALYNADMTTLIAAFSAGANTFTVPESVIAICDEAFAIDPSEQLGIQDVYIGENVIDIHDWAFRDYNGGELPTLHVVEGSSAHQFAVKHGRAYVLRGSEGDISLQEKMDAVIAECIAEEMTERQKAKALHDWICANVVYDDALTKRSARSALIEGVSVCQGYTYAYAQLLDAVGIENELAVDLPMNHIWNLAKLDGVWTYVDCTWSDTGDRSYFGFNADICYMTHGGHRDDFADDAYSLELYAPYTDGEYDAIIEEVTALVQEKINAGENSFSICGYSDIACGILLTQLRDTMWMSGDVNYKLNLRGYVGENTIGCIPYIDGSDAGADEKDFNVSLHGDGIVIDAYIGEAEDVVIPEILFGYPVTAIGEGAFYENESLRRIVIPDSVNEIRSYAFSGCIRLEEAVLGQAVQELGDGVFFGCTQLKGIELPDTLQSMGASIFSSAGITEIVLPEKVSRIPDFCFYNSRLESIECSGTIAEIGRSAFSNCRIREYHAREGLLTLGEAAFSQNTQLAVFTMPASVLQVGDGVFSGCTILREMNNHASAGVFIWDNGVVLVDNGRVLSCVMPWVEELIVADSVEEIAPFAAAEASALKSVVMGNRVTALGSFAFYECDSLERIVFSDNIEVLPRYLLGNCYHLSDVHWPAKLKRIEEGAIYICSDYVMLPDIEILPAYSVVTVDAERVVVSETTRMIEESGLTIHGDSEIWMPAGVAEIADGMLNASYAYTIVCDAGSCAENYALRSGIKYIAFPKLDADFTLMTKGETGEVKVLYDGKPEFSKIEWRSSDAAVAEVKDGIIRALDGGAARISAIVENRELIFDVAVHCDRQVVLPEGVSVIEREAFIHSGAKEYVLPDGLQVIGERAFADNGELLLVNLPDGVQIAADAFDGCGRLTVICSEGSTGHAYARTHNIPCVIQ